MILGVDVSTYLEELEHNAQYFDGDVQIDPLDALRANGVSCMRIRVWNDPHAPDGTPYLAGTCDINHYVRLAKLAKSKGYSLMLDFHYSDFWADPGKQMIPKAWASFDIDKMEEAVYSFTKSCLETACAEDVAPTFTGAASRARDKELNELAARKDGLSFLKGVGAYIETHVEPGSM
ncbi:MAG: glycosyl hydrolase 53 family protein, partial [Clostridia bacterium]|nr:glycosyl hydrolase 53 family protein [Clostridia bacterium]MBQ3014784.1 glycosyl hydrolase 53 family protein [Clostridia bacterium]